MLYQQLALGEAKKRYAHFIVDYLTLRNTYANTQLYNFVERLFTIETSCTIASFFRSW